MNRKNKNYIKKNKKFYIIFIVFSIVFGFFIVGVLVFYLFKIQYKINLFEIINNNLENNIFDKTNSIQNLKLNISYLKVINHNKNKQINNLNLKYKYILNDYDILYNKSKNNLIIYNNLKIKSNELREKLEILLNEINKKKQEKSKINISNIFEYKNFEK